MTAYKLAVDGSSSRGITHRDNHPTGSNMTFSTKLNNLQLTSTVTDRGVLELQLSSAPVPTLAPDEVLVRVEATPINPSDVIALIGHADPSQADFEGSLDRPVVTTRLSPEAIDAMVGRKGIQLPIGLEGAGTVVETGDQVRELLGKRVAAAVGGMWAQFRVVKAAACQHLPPDVSCAEGASIYVNPMTALAMIETMRLEGHTALVHTAAASNLGQMLLNVCREDGVPLVNVVRRPAQVELLRALGASHVVDSSAPNFRNDLLAAVSDTGATLGFDAIGGGRAAHEILTAMEKVGIDKMTEYSPYGSFLRKQVYIYGLLDRSPTYLDGSYGPFWGIGGWMMPMITHRIGPERTEALSRRILNGLRTTFASRYTRQVSLADALKPEILTGCDRHATGEKYLINPTL
jgi:NADPH:quinone reductase